MRVVFTRYKGYTLRNSGAGCTPKFGTDVDLRLSHPHTVTTAQISLRLPSNPRQAQPKPQNDPKQRQNNRLQHLNTLSLRNGTDCEREDRRSGATKRSGEPDCADVQMPGKQLCSDDYRSGEQWAHQEALQSDRYGRNVELWDEPEDELEGHGQRKVDLQMCVSMWTDAYALDVGLTAIANFSPIRGVTKPSMTLPTVMPIQYPVATIPLAKFSPLRTSSMNLTIQPPRATSMPT